MRLRWSRRNDQSGLEAELREQRPEPRPAFLASLAESVREHDRPRRSARAPRLAFAVVLTATMLVVAGTMGGFGYAASAARQALDGFQTLVATSGQDAIGVAAQTPGSDQYAPGFAWGDASQNHAGPPGLTQEGGALAPPLQALCRDGVAKIETTIVLDEQAVLRIAVLDENDQKFPLTVLGGTTESAELIMVYRVLVPGAIPLELEIPCDLLTDGLTYNIRVVATDPSGEKTKLLIPFRPFTAAD